MTDQIYIAVGKGAAGKFDKLDDENLRTGAFRETDLTENAPYIGKELGVFAINPDDPGFESFRTQLLTGYQAQREALEKTPIAVSLHNAIFLMENPNVFQITIPSNAEIAGELKEIFPTSAKSGGKYSGTDYEKITLRFDRRDIKPEQRAELKAFVERMRPKSLEQVTQRGGIGYLNLLIFAGRVEQSAPEQKPSSPPPEPTGPQPLVPDEPRHMYCTSEGASPAGETKPAVPGTEPILEHFGESDIERPDVIYMPLRKTHFQLNKDEPVDKQKFKRTIAQMVDDLYKITSGEFAKTCGMQRQFDFGEELRIYFVGMADKLGSPERNQELSAQRAKKVAEEFFKQLIARNTTEPLKSKNRIAILYGGVGEKGAKEIDPEFRQTRAVITTGAVSSEYLDTTWYALESINPTGEHIPVSIKDQCTSQEMGCEELLEEGLSMVQYMCNDIYSDPSDEELCGVVLTSFVWGVNNERVRGLFPEVANWLWDRGRYRLPVFHMKEQSLNNYSLLDYIRETRRLLRKNGPHLGPPPIPRKQDPKNPHRDWKIIPDNILVPGATRIDISPDVEFFYFERSVKVGDQIYRDRFTIPADECTIEDRPGGAVFFYNPKDGGGRKYIATLGKHPIAIFRRTGTAFLVIPTYSIGYYPPFRLLHLENLPVETLNETDRKHLDRVMAQIRKDVEEAINMDGFHDRMPLRRPTGKVTDILITFRHVSPDHYGALERYVIDQLEKEFGERVRITEDHEKTPRDRVVPPGALGIAIYGYRESTTETEPPLPDPLSSTSSPVEGSEEPSGTPVEVETPQEE